MTENSTQPDVQYVNIHDLPHVRHEKESGIRMAALPVTDRARGWILDFFPGTRWPEVDHHAEEEHFYVLSGELIDGDRVHRAGDYVVMAAGTSHQPHTESGASLLVLAIGAPTA
ncbi:hypothetical protein SRB5_20170 [Streptomyces sp. RB5]|uniref:ChrR-like cupin domain-containing protein n=1 Tax=Streptomyces smaragdinus TaxID=2585196 RepID=A0A7K0CEK2_9ACTN|nr:cupin domain-containing protein [Streptomyces smaragdinus]MQY11898.1 hypothetical protein [Streptomyces smaragdinus]